MIRKISIVAMISMMLCSCKINGKADTSDVLATRNGDLDLILVCRIATKTNSFQFVSLGARVDEFGLSTDAETKDIPCYAPLNYEKHYSKNCYANVTGRKNVKTDSVNAKTTAVIFSWNGGGGIWERYLVNMPNNWSSLDTFDGFIKFYSAVPVNLKIDLSKDSKAAALHCKTDFRLEKK